MIFRFWRSLKRFSESKALRTIIKCRNKELGSKVKIIKLESSRDKREENIFGFWHSYKRSSEFEILMTCRSMQNAYIVENKDNHYRKYITWYWSQDNQTRTFERAEKKGKNLWNMKYPIIKLNHVHFRHNTILQKMGRSYGIITLNELDT